MKVFLELKKREIKDMISDIINPILSALPEIIFVVIISLLLVGVSTLIIIFVTDNTTIAGIILLLCLSIDLIIVYICQWLRNNWIEAGKILKERKNEKL